MGELDRVEGNSNSCILWSRGQQQQLHLVEQRAAAAEGDTQHVREQLVECQQQKHNQQEEMRQMVHASAKAAHTLASAVQAELAENHCALPLPLVVAAIDKLESSAAAAEAVHAEAEKRAVHAEQEAERLQQELDRVKSEIEQQAQQLEERAAAAESDIQHVQEQLMECQQQLHQLRDNYEETEQTAESASQALALVDGQAPDYQRVMLILICMISSISNIIPFANSPDTFY